MKDILQEITRLRLERGWSEYELAQNSGLSQSTISTWYRKIKLRPSKRWIKYVLGSVFHCRNFLPRAQMQLYSLRNKKKYWIIGPH